MSTTDISDNPNQERQLEITGAIVTIAIITVVTVTILIVCTIKDNRKQKKLNPPKTPGTKAYQLRHKLTKQVIPNIDLINQQFGTNY
jgi:hypothetical protein